LAVVRIVKLHRAAFPGIDIFPAIVELERCSDAAQRAANIYQCYDLWRLHPDDHQTDLKAAYVAILGDLEPMHPIKDKRARLRVAARYIKNGTVKFPRRGIKHSNPDHIGRAGRAKRDPDGGDAISMQTMLKAEGLTRQCA
jgi:hypothetical protein